MNISKMIKKAVEELTTFDILKQYKTEIDKLIQKAKEVHAKNPTADEIEDLPKLFGGFGRFVKSYCERGFAKDEVVANDISITVYLDKYNIKKTLSEITQYLDDIIKKKLN